VAYAGHRRRMTGQRQGRRQNVRFMGSPQQGQGHEAVLPALAAADMHPHHVTVDIGDGQIQGLTQPQTQTVGGEKVDLIAELASAADQLPDLLQGVEIDGFGALAPQSKLGEVALVQIVKTRELSAFITLLLTGPSGMEGVRKVQTIWASAA